MSEEAPHAETGRSPLRRSTRLYFGVGQLAEGIKTYGFSLFVLFYYNTVLGLPGSWTGLAVAIALVADAVSDPVMGSISDRFDSRWGRRHPFMVAAALPLGLSFWGLFAPPSGLDETGLFLWLTVFAVATRAAMTAYHVPHMSLGAELSSDYAERTRLVAVRQIFGYVGIIAMVVIGFGGFFADARGGRTNAEAYAPFGLAMAVLMVASILISVWGTWDQIPRLRGAGVSTASHGGGVARIVDDTRGAFRSPSFRRLFAGTLCIYVMVGTESALSLYIYEFFWGLGSREILGLSLLYPFGLIAGAFLTHRLHSRWDKSPTLVFGVVGWFVCQVGPVLLRLADWFPGNGTVELVATLFAVRLVQGIVVQQALVSFSSMMADIADEHELATGRRQEGIFFGVVSFSGKAASGVGSLIAGVALDVIGWPTGLAAAGARAVTDGTVRALGVVYGPLVAGFAVVALLGYRGYDLDRERHRAVSIALAARRGTASPPG
jgi:Na+/melibiose symporter-like transporter